eukprot:1151591-Pleurochrysis_carterae.AAC.1
MLSDLQLFVIGSPLSLSYPSPLSPHPAQARHSGCRVQRGSSRAEKADANFARNSARNFAPNFAPNAAPNAAPKSARPAAA